MPRSLLNLFLKFSAFIFHLKQKLLGVESISGALFYSLAILLAELGLIIVSLPLYFFVSPKKLQERGFIFPVSEYEKRRKISLAAIFGAGGVFILKTLLIIFLSGFLLAGQILLAATESWTFTTPGNYVYDSAKIEVTGGAAQLKNLSSPVSGGTLNSGFDSGSANWTFVPTWSQPGGAINTGTYKASGGNPAGHIEILIDAKKSATGAAFWYQAFTTTVNSPSTATLNLDWMTDTINATFLNSYRLYAFIETTAGNPTIGGANQVWDSGNITGATGWASIVPIDIKAKIPTAGTYYLKIGAYANSNSTNAPPDIISSFDNVAVAWSGAAAASYASDKPTIKPTASLNPGAVSAWSSFTETATKNGGEIYYQLSSDNGSTWQYWNGSAWASAGAANYNTASVVNANIGSFSAANNQIIWQAFLSSSGAEQVILDNIDIGYTENDLPDIVNLSPAQNSNNGLVYVNYDLTDNESDPSDLVTYEYSLTGAFAGEERTMTASSSDIFHEGVSGLNTSPTGASHVFAWDAKADVGSIYDSSVYVRLRANDGIGNGAYATSSPFALDYVNPIVSNVSAAQTAGETNVVINYDLADDTADSLTVELDISEDGGITWDVADTSVSGNVGSGVSAGVGKLITWNAGADFDEQAQADLQVRVRAKDKFQNQGNYAPSANFALDTLNPAVNTTANLLAQPNAGDTAALIGGSFIEINPNTNNFFAAINGGAYGSATAGDSNTATPSNQSTAIGATLDGNDYISKVKITHQDDFGQSTDNENLSPNASYKYVKPYTPEAPTLSNPATTALNLTINPHVSEALGLEYAIYENTTGKYAQANGSLGASAVWQTIGTSAGQWGNSTAVSGKVNVSGLTSPVANYVFKVKSRNPSDGSHAASSESAFSATAQITNTAPAITLNSIAQTTDGTKYTLINYTGTDAQGDINALAAIEYSRDNSNWFTMTEKSGAGSDGISGLIFSSSGTSHVFAWDSGADLAGVEDASVYIRLKSNDGIADSALAASSAFAIDNILPVISNLSASQNTGAKTVNISYDLADANNSLVEIDISDDGGATWSVTDTIISGDIGSGVTPGIGKTITWNAGLNFSGQYQIDLRVRARAKDIFGNQGANVESANFSLDTKAPSLSNLSASQNAGADTFVFSYDLAEDAGNVIINLAISADSGSTWNIATSSAAGDLGAIVAVGNNKIITWDAGIDYSNQEKSGMKIRITATDNYGNSTNSSSANFSLDTYAPRITNVSASQNAGSTNVSFGYDLADINNSLVELDISANGGSTWTVADTSVSGDVGSGVGSGNGKLITWNAGVDFDEQNQADLQVRIRAKDSFNHQGNYVASANFALDTLNPAVNTTANLLAQPNAGNTSALIGGSFTETNPNTNNFFVAINGGAYSVSTAGEVNTASPSNQATNIGIALDGNDYISKVKITHQDDFGQSIDNENLSPNASYKYVKPYTPGAPTVDNPAVGSVNVLINPNVSEASGLEYAIYENTSAKYVQANGTLGASAVWRTIGTSAGQWGYAAAVSGKVNVNGLVNDSYTYQFQIKSRNSSDNSHAATSESALSGAASSANQSPQISINSVSQIANGLKYVTINYTGSDLESEASHLIVYKYSTDNLNWSTMTEKSGAGSSGTSSLAFTASGASFNFVWDVGADLPNTEDATVYVRLQASDGVSSGNIAASNSFIIDTKNPVIANLSGAQSSGSNNVIFSYDLVDLSSATVELDISDDSGGTWGITDTSVSGDVGVNISPAASKAITWAAGTDFNNQEQANMKLRVRARDNFGNQGAYTTSANFALDTADPVISNVSALQNIASSSVAISYDLADANNSLVEIDISENGGSTWTVVDTSVSGDIGSGISPGVSKSINWYAGTDFSGQDQADIKVRVRATDIFSNAGSDVESANFSLDTLGPIISNVSAAQTAGSRNVVISYDLVDNSAVNVLLDISEDGGLTWDVATSSIAGDVGSGISAGAGKLITWNAGADFNNQNQNDLKIRLRGFDSFNNASGNVLSANFSLDTLSPAVNIAADLAAQPQAGNTSALIGGSFTETNPNTNNFFVAINGGAYSVSTVGEANTESPANQATNIGIALDGNDYISKVKITHQDDFGQSTDNENLSPNASYKYVKPYTPKAPSVANPTVNSLDISVNPHASEVSGLDYAIYENSTDQYIQADGSLGASAVWQTQAAWATTTVINLNSPVAQYSFQTKSRNGSDASHAAISESSLSNVGAISNTAPSISIDSASQQLGANYVLINYSGRDYQNDLANLNAYEYSTDNLNWLTMTEKSGVGSSGTSSLAFTASGASFSFAWDSVADLPSYEDSTVYVRLQASDGIGTSNLAASSAFAIDNLGPAVSNILVSQTPGTDQIIFEYGLADNSGADNTVYLDISDNGGITWNIASSSVSGDIGPGVGAGLNRSITWDAGTDFNSQEQADMKVRIRASDIYANVGEFISSNNFTLDTRSPIITNVSAAQSSGSKSVAINYTLSDISSAGNFVELNISDDNGLSWNVATSSVSGHIGSGQTSGAKTLAWNAGVNFNNQNQADMQARIRARDYFGHQGIFASSSAFALDTQTVVTPTPEPAPAPAPVIGGAVILFPFNILPPAAPAESAPKTELAPSPISEEISEPQLMQPSQPVAESEVVSPEKPATVSPQAPVQIPAQSQGQSQGQPTPSTAIVPPAPIITSPTPIISIPAPKEIIQETMEAVELPSIAPPKLNYTKPIVDNNIINFSGTALPNQYVVVYIHSEKALIYRVQADSNGIWSVNHSQELAELAVGDHTIFAVAIDPGAKVKSRPSLVSQFEIKKNFWVEAYQKLDLKTTIITIIILLTAMSWLYKIQNASQPKY